MRRTKPILYGEINTSGFIRSLYETQRFEERGRTNEAITLLLKRHNAGKKMMSLSQRTGYSQVAVLSILSHFESTGKLSSIIEMFKDDASGLFRGLTYCKYCPEVLQIGNLKTVFAQPKGRKRLSHDYIPADNEDDENKYLFFLQEAKTEYYSGFPSVSNFEYDVIKQIAIALLPEEEKDRLLSFEGNVPITFVGAINTLFTNSMYGKETTFLTFPNVEGLRVAILYENGIMKQATALDIDITKVINGIQSIPKNIPIQTPTTIEGVLYVPKKAFHRLNYERKVFGQPMWKDMKTSLIQLLHQDPQNLARVFDTDLSFSTDRFSNENNSIEREGHRFELLRSLGFPVLRKTCFSVLKPQDFNTTSTVTKLGELVHVGATLNDFPFFTEGLVIRLNIVGNRSLLGGGEVIYKTIPRLETKKVSDISYNIGKENFIFPVALLSDATRVSFENTNDILELDLRVGDTVLYMPEQQTFLSSARDSSSNEIQPCTHCPKCGGKVVEKFGVPHCKSRLTCRCLTIEEVAHFISPNGFNITHLGHSLIAELIEKNIITVQMDILNMKEEDQQLLENTTKETFNALLSQIKQSKSGIPLKNFLYALNIPLIPYHVAQHLEDTFKTWSELISHNGDFGIEASAAKELRNFLDIEKEDLQRLFNSGVIIIGQQETISELCSKKEFTKGYFKLIQEKIRIHSEKYDISDSEFDTLSDKYDEILKKHPSWASKEDGIVQFPDPLAWLKKTNDEDTLKRLAGKIMATQQYVCIEPKVDGFACSLHYKNGTLFMATVKLYKTTSHDITKLVMQIPSIPKTIKHSAHPKGFTGVVRGEIYIPKKDMTKLNMIRQTEGMPTFKNTVPALVSMIRSGTMSDKLSFFAFHLEPPDKNKSRQALYLSLQKMGFDKSLYRFCRTFGLSEELDQYISAIATRKSEMPVEIDGLVLKANDPNTDINPLGYKFPIEFHIVEVEKATPSKTGTTIRFGTLKLTDGNEVSKVIVENKIIPLKKGDKVKISYTKGVQPFLDSVINLTPSEEDKDREYCMNCGKKLKPNSEGIPQCFNFRCSSEKLRNLLKYSRYMGIKTRYGKKSLITTLYNRGLLTNPSDLYRLIVEDFKDIPEYEVRLFLSEVSNSKDRPLVTFIRAFNIGNIKPETITKLCDQTDSLKALIAKSEEDMKENGIPDKSAKLLARFFKAHKDDFDYFVKIGMTKNSGVVNDLDKSFVEWKKERTEMVDLINLVTTKAGIFLTKTRSLNMALRSSEDKKAEANATYRAQEGIGYIIKYILAFIKKLN